jgi:hypothetical protein
MFHFFIFRHPIFWFSVALCLAAAKGHARTSNAIRADKMRLMAGIVLASRDSIGARERRSETPAAGYGAASAQ